MEEERNHVEVKKKKGTSFMKNVLVLMFSQIMVKILGFVYKLVITNFEGFGDTGLGYYSAGYQVYSLLLALSSIGIPNVVSKLVSERVAIGDNKGAQRIFKICMTFFTVTGLILSIALFFGAETIARVVFNVQDTKYVMQVLAPAVVFVAASAVFRGYFAGLNDMKPTSYSQIIEQLFNCILSITFVYALIGKEPYIMAAGGNLSTTCAIVLTFIYLIAYYKRNKIKVKRKQVSPEAHKTTRQLLKTILIMSLPITFSSVISIISPLIDSTTVSRCIQSAFASMYPIKEELEAFAMSMTGILSKVDTLTAMPIAVNIAFSTALVPVISTAIAKKDYKTASKRMTFSLFASILIIIPCACGFIALAQPILSLIYPTASDGASVFILCSISMIFVALNQTINGGLYGVNKSYIPAIAIILSVFVKIGLNITLISNPNIGINGSGISSIVAQGLVFIICIIALNKNLKLDFKFGRMVVTPIVSGILMGGSVYLIHHGLNKIMGNSISTIISIILGAIIYILAILLSKTLTKEEILMLPYGTKIYPLLVKMKFYKDRNVNLAEEMENLNIEETESEELKEAELYSNIEEKQEREDKGTRQSFELIQEIPIEASEILNDFVPNSMKTIENPMIKEKEILDNLKAKDSRETRNFEAEESAREEKYDMLQDENLKEEIKKKIDFLNTKEMLEAADERREYSRDSRKPRVPDFEKEVTVVFEKTDKFERKVRMLFEDEEAVNKKRKRTKEKKSKKEKERPNKSKVQIEEKRTHKKTNGGRHSK